MNVLTDVGAVAIGRNEGERLARCLRSLIGTVGQVVYVDSGSTDGSVELARSLGADVVELDMNQPFTAARARNAGLERLKEIMERPAFVQFVDGDCEVVDGWLLQARSALSKDASLAVVCGRRRERSPEASVYNLLCDLEWDTPIGLADSCGGDAMMRIAALDQVDGYDDTIIAGEEPELCYRLRRRGLRVRRIDAEMTLHDAAMTTFGQWSRRAMRAGHACAEGAWRHGRSVERFNVRRLARVGFWGAALPVGLLLLMLVHSWVWMFGVAAYGVQFWRIRGQQLSRGRPQRQAETYAFYTVIDKFPAFWGAARFFAGAVTGRRSGIIEYKGQASADGTGCSVVYLAPVLPALSETFVYREIFALGDEGLSVTAATVRPSTEQFDGQLAALRDSAVGVYGPGPVRLAMDALLESVLHPRRTIDVAGLAIRDMTFGSDLDGKARWKIGVQAVGALALARRLRGRRPVRIHAHFAHVPATIAMYAARQLGAAFSFTGHANDLFRERTLLAEKLERADRVMCISDWHRELYQQVGVYDPSKFAIVRCAVDVREFRAGDGPREGLLAVGRLVEKKGFSVLIRALGAMRDRGASVTCRIVGEGPQRAELEGLIQSLGLSDQVQLCGALPNEQVRELMRSSSLFVLPCIEDARGDRDGIPVVLMEAMATGMCVVAGSLPAIRELVIDDETGVMATPGDVDELAEAIASLMDDPDRASRLAERGRTWVREEFSRDVNVERLLAAFGITPRAGSRIEGRPLPFDAGEREAAEPRRIRA